MYVESKVRVEGWVAVLVAVALPLARLLAVARLWEAELVLVLAALLQWVLRRFSSVVGLCL